MPLSTLSIIRLVYFLIFTVTSSSSAAFAVVGFNNLCLKSFFAGELQGNIIIFNTFLTGGEL